MIPVPSYGAVVDDTGLRLWFNQARQQMLELVRRALERTAILASQYAQHGMFVSRTGFLRQSITWGVQMGGEGGVAVVRANAPYAHFIENGTKEHLIFPRRKQFLRFVQNGVVRFSKGVIHPGTRARHFMADAQTKAAPLLEQLLNEAVVRAFV